MFGTKPKTTHLSPLEKGDNPELDTSEFLGERGRQMYMSIIESLQWAISIGRLDISVAVMTLLSFRAFPRKGHMDRAKRVIGYLARFKDGSIRFRTQEPDYSELPRQDLDWATTVYGKGKEIIPKDAPVPLGKPVTMTHYYDANLYHDMVTGRSVIGVIHLINRTPIDWYA